MQRWCGTHASSGPGADDCRSDPHHHTPHRGQGAVTRPEGCPPLLTSAEEVTAPPLALSLSLSRRYTFLWRGVKATVNEGKEPGPNSRNASSLYWRQPRSEKLRRHFCMRPEPRPHSFRAVRNARPPMGSVWGVGSETSPMHQRHERESGSWLFHHGMEGSNFTWHLSFCVW